MKISLNAVVRKAENWSLPPKFNVWTDYNLSLHPVSTQENNKQEIKYFPLSVPKSFLPQNTLI